MGNIVQCCDRLSNYFRCKDALAQGGPERSPLLSSEESECDWPSLPDDLEDDLLTVSTGVTNRALEPENFLFPDIILSSHLGGDVTLVEPMVCLLVSEEEDGVKVEDRQERSSIGTNRVYSEVETQTERETQIGMGVQTQRESQAEVETQTEMIVCDNDTVEGDVNELTNTGTTKEMGEHEILIKVDALTDIQPSQQRCSESVTNLLSEKENQKKVDIATWPDIKRQTEKNKMPLRDLDKEAEEETVKENKVHEHAFQTELKVKVNAVEGDFFKSHQNNIAAQENSAQTEQNDLMTQENIKDSKQNIQSECCSMMETLKETSKCCITDTDIVESVDPDECCVVLTQQNEQRKEATGVSEQNVNEDHIQCQDVQLETTLQQLEDDGAEMKTMTLFLVDRQFLASPYVEVPSSQIGGSPEEADADKLKQLSIRDIVDLQETSFTVKIQPPGAESFELQVAGQMLVTELHQVLMDHEITCHRTCYSLQLGSATLHSFRELHSVQGIQDGALLKVVEDPYTVRDARLHLRHVCYLLRSLDPTDTYNGLNGSSLSYLTFYTRADKAHVGPDTETGGKRRASDKGSDYCSPPEYILPGCKERLLTPLQPIRDDWKPLQCLRVLTMSSWNPPPGNRKMHGDLMYLSVLTMEDRELNITSSTRGFYLNQSTAFNFNPKPAVPKLLCHSLVELLSHVSPVFKTNFSALQKKRVQRHPYERISAPFQVFSWTAPHGDHTLDCVRAEETHTSHISQDEHTTGQSRDWNEELQGCRELPRNTHQERLQRERSIFKTNSDFVAAATRGAVAVIDGNVMPINPGEPHHMQMFIWNNIFFSLTVDISDQYGPLGGNTAARAAAMCDLRGAQGYVSVDVKGLHTLGTAVVDYRGIRAIAQTILPGILEKNQDQSVVYGSNDYGKTVFTHPRFLELLDKTSKPLRLQRHQVLDHSNVPVELCSGIETKGILGNDGRPYILDLLRTSPPDLNFQLSESEVTRQEVPKECQRFGYPRRHHHSLASLRPELIDAFIQDRYELYVKMVSLGLSHLEEKNKATEQREDLVCESTAGHTSTAGADMEHQRRDIIMKACEAVGSASNSFFDLRFNPNVCSPGVRFPSECGEEVQRQKQLLWDAAAFLLSNQIPAVLRDGIDHTAMPLDGATLTLMLHQRGVNVRYLGILLRELDRMEEGGRLSHIQRISISELIVRSAKHIFKTYLQDVEPAAFSAAVSHFLNCFLSFSSGFPDSCRDELLSRRRSRRRRSRVAVLTDTVWSRLTSSELWGRIRTEAGDYYNYTVISESIDEVIEKQGLQRISLLREMAIKTGIQVQLRDYMFESRHRPVFGEEDIVNMFPVVKHLKFTSTDATQLVHHAQNAVQQGLLRNGYELICQALTLFSSVCGVLHEDVCTCLRLLGRLSYILGEYADALCHQEKAAIISERIQGIDHLQTIQDHLYLGLYCFAGGQHSTSLQLMYRARYLVLLVTGEDHPQVALLDSMLGLVLHGLMEYELSLKFLKNALDLTSKYHGSTSLKVANSHHLVASLYESKGEFRSALQHEKKAYLIYKSQVGVHHNSTKESSEYLKSLTQQAVILQKAINHLYSNTPRASIPPPKLTTPNLPTILQELNQTCGIILIPLSAKEIVDLRTEMKGKGKV